MPYALSRYVPLRVFLADHPTDRVQLSFAEVEALIGHPLPMSAYMRSWWANTLSGNRIQVRAWRSAGWSVSSVNLSTRVVTFVRDVPE